MTTSQNRSDAHETIGHGSGSKLLHFDFEKVDFSSLTICIWQDFIVAGSNSSNPLRMWTQNFQKVKISFGFSAPTKAVQIIIPWNDRLVIANGRTLQIWKLSKKKPFSVKMRRVTEVKTERSFESGIIWGDFLYTPLSESIVTVWNPEGKLMLHIDGRYWTNALVFEKKLWTVPLYCPEITILSKISDCHYSYTIARSFGGYNDINALCIWDDHVVSGCSTGIVKIWTNKDKLKYNTTIEVGIPIYLMTAWKRRLVCTVRASEADTDKLLIFGTDRVLKQQIKLDDVIIGMVSFGGNLWLGGKKSLYLLQATNWKKERVLWIGWKKNNPKDCHIAALPKEIVRLILEYVRGAQME